MKIILFIILSFIYVGNISAQEEKYIIPMTVAKTGFILDSETGEFVDYVKMALAKTIGVDSGKEDIVLIAYDPSTGDWEDFPINKCNLSGDIEIRAYYIDRKQGLGICALFRAEDFKKGYLNVYNNFVRILLEEGNIDF